MDQQPTPSEPRSADPFSGVPWPLVLGPEARAPRPLLVLVCTGQAYGVSSTVLSAVLSPIMLGDPQGPVTNPSDLVAVLAVNAPWGLVAGAIALAVRSAPGSRQSGT